MWSDSKYIPRAWCARAVMADAKTKGGGEQTLTVNIISWNESKTSLQRVHNYKEILYRIRYIDDKTRNTNIYLFLIYSSSSEIEVSKSLLEYLVSCACKVRP